MDEKRDPPEAPEADPERSERDRSSSADRLVGRLAELRSQIDVIAPSDQAKGREALDRIRESQERIAALEEMLAAAREREDELATQAIRNRAKLFQAEARISELDSIAARVADAEDARHDAEAAARESQRLAARAENEMEAAEANIALLRTRNAELESDMTSVAEELAAATLARAEAARMEQERDEARERAHVERRLAAEDRLRAAESALRATELQHRLRDAERRIVQLTNASRRSNEAGAEREDAEPAEATPPWIELQRNSTEEAAEPDPLPEDAAVPEPSASGSVASVASTDDPWAPPEPMWGSSTASLSEAGAAGEKPDVIDLTHGEEEKASDEETSSEDPDSSNPEEPPGWTESARQLLWGRRKDR